MVKKLVLVAALTADHALPSFAIMIQRSDLGI